MYLTYSPHVMRRIYHIFYAYARYNTAKRGTILSIPFYQQVSHFKNSISFFNNKWSLSLFLAMSKTEPDLEFLKKRLDIRSKKELIARLKTRVEELDLKLLARDVEPFLFDPSQKDRVLHFKEWLDTF